MCIIYTERSHLHFNHIPTTPAYPFSNTNIFLIFNSIFYEPLSLTRIAPVIIGTWKV